MAVGRSQILPVTAEFVSHSRVQGIGWARGVWEELSRCRGNKQREKQMHRTTEMWEHVPVRMGVERLHGLGQAT